MKYEIIPFLPKLSPNWLRVTYLPKAFTLLPLNDMTGILIKPISSEDYLV